MDVAQVRAAMHRDTQASEDPAAIMRRDTIFVKFSIEFGQYKRRRIPVPRAGLDRILSLASESFDSLLPPVAASAVNVARMFANMLVWKL